MIIDAVFWQGGKRNIGNLPIIWPRGPGFCWEVDFDRLVSRQDKKFSSVTEITLHYGNRSETMDPPGLLEISLSLSLLEQFTDYYRLLSRSWHSKNTNFIIKN